MTPRTSEPVPSMVGVGLTVPRRARVVLRLVEEQPVEADNQWSGECWALLDARTGWLHIFPDPDEDAGNTWQSWPAYAVVCVDWLNATGEERTL